MYILANAATVVISVIDLKLRPSSQEPDGINDVDLSCVEVQRG